MTPELAAIAAALLAVLGMVGIIVPVLPGSLTVVVALLVWAVWGGAPWGWVLFGVGTVLVVVGAAASYLLTARTLQAANVPQWPIRVALVVGVVASFVLPALGLVIGFVVTLLLCEWWRVKELRAALRTSWTAIRSIGLGMLVELGLASTAATMLAISVVTTLL